MLSAGAWRGMASLCRPAHRPTVGQQFQLSRNLGSVGFESLYTKVTLAIDIAKRAKALFV